MKIEIFSYTTDEVDTIESDINDFFKEHPDIKVKFITQSESVREEVWSLTISIFYIEDILKGGQED